jgi:hypothetical protein
MVAIPRCDAILRDGGKNAMLSNSTVIAIFFVLLIGFYLVARIARTAISTRDLKGFFLGGGNIGADLTENNTLGITFAWSGGTWYFAWLAYQYGPWVLVSQIFWCSSIVALAILLPRIIKNIRNRTIHGFLALHYDRKTQRIAAIATTTGYLINGGFELVWASILFSLALGRPNLVLPIALVLGIFVGSYCTIGGYRANVRIDKVENLLGVIALAGLVAFVAASEGVSGAVLAAVTLFCLGSIVYLSVSLLMYSSWLRSSFRFERIQNIGAFISLVTAFFIAFILLWPLAANDQATQRIVKNSFDVSPYLIVLTISFQLFFNVIDMQNWQQIAANGDASPSTYRDLSWAIIRGSLYLMWFPALGGLLLGAILRASNTTLNDQTLFSHAFALVAPTSDDFIRGIILGLLLLGFLATSLSTAGDLLMSALQTLSYDILWSDRVDTFLDASTGDEDTQHEFVIRARKLLIPMGILMVVVFFTLNTVYPGPVINFQAIMYAIPISLLTPTLFALFGSPEISRGGGTAAFFAIGASTFAVAGMFIYTLIPGRTEDEINWWIAFTPVASNALSFLVFFLYRKIDQRRYASRGRMMTP